MSEQTESLLKILNIGDSGKKKANVHVPQFQYRRSAQRANYRMRLNSVPVESSISALGQTCRIQLPSYTNLCGEIYLKLKFAELSQGTWNPRVAASAVSRMVLRHSDIAYEVENPAAVFAYCLSKMRNKEEKELRKELFGTATASGDEQNCIITLLHPWCYFFQPEFSGDAVMHCSPRTSSKRIVCGKSRSHPSHPCARVPLRGRRCPTWNLFGKSWCVPQRIVRSLKS